MLFNEIFLKAFVDCHAHLNLSDINFMTCANDAPVRVFFVKSDGTPCYVSYRF
jgi:hypothetical protein